MKTPNLQVVAGAGRSASPWLDFPATVAARSPNDREQACTFRVSKTDVLKAATRNRRQPAFDLWAGVIGQPPPVNNVATYNADAAVGLTGLGDAHACFIGVKRPWAEDDGGEHCLAYICKPRFLYRYQLNLACVAEKVAVPDDLLFVIYVKLDQPYSENSLLPRGVVTHTGLVEADASDPLLPIDYATRYTAQLW